MTSNYLSTYLSDHLAGSVSAEELVSHLLELELDPELESALRDVGESIGRHQEQVRSLLRVRGDREHRGKSVGGWLAEKLVRPVLASSGEDQFGMLRSLEMLILGMHGRVALWQTMEVVVPSHPELSGFDATVLRVEAQHQVEKMDRLRVATARTALRGWTSGEEIIPELVTD